MHRVDAVGNSPGVRWELTEGIRSLLGWCKGVRQKKTETRWKIIGGSRKAYRELGWSCNRCLAIMIGLVFTQRRSVMDVDMPQEVGLGSGRRPLEIRLRDRKACWEHVGRLPEEDRKTHCKNAEGCRIGGRFDLHPKKIGSGRQCALRRRTREWT
ncbi:hypothetical protein BHE74_00008096 [Ensete ventricosum]|nr:hypothetical protein BHE74_00008096 [Ensete ventricosum]